MTTRGNLRGRVIFGLLAASAVGAASIVACVGDEPGVGTVGNDDGGSSDGGASDGAIGNGDGGDVDACTGTVTCGSTSCVSLDTDPNNCGTCGRVCKSSDGSKTFGCVKGACGQLAIQAGAGNDASCVLLSEGTVWCWGAQKNGITGTVNAAATPTPQKVGGLTNVVEIRVGAATACARDANGDVWCWGDNSYGQTGQPLSTGSTECGSTCDPVPKKVVLPEKAAQLTGSGPTMCARTAPGNVYCWGMNDGNVLNLGTDGTSSTSTTATATPVKIGVFAGDVIDVNLEFARPVQNFGFHASACAVRADHTVWCWGADEMGQLGHAQGSSGGDISCAGGIYFCNGTPKPILVSNGGANFGNVTKVATHREGACVLKDDQTVWCWGSNVYGELGTTPDNLDHLYPVESDTSVVDLASGDQAIFGFQSSANVIDWGVDTSGVRALGGYTADASVAKSPGLSGVKTVSALFDHGIALETNGTLLTWGNNTNGALGHAPNAAGSGDSTCPASADAGTYCNPTAKPMTDLPWN